MSKPRLLVLSHVMPFPGNSGQQQRVFYTLQAARKKFHVTFGTVAVSGRAGEIKEKLSAFCDDTLLLPARYPDNKAGKVWHKTVGTLYSLSKGLKYSNYIIGHLEFSPARISSLLGANKFDCVLFEYWHAAQSTAVFHNKGIPCVLDMHNVLWQDYFRDLNANQHLPECWKRRSVNKYRAHEEEAWQHFDALITINSEEHKYVEQRILKSTRLFYAPMGTDLSVWPYSWKPSQPIRVAYYGGLGSQHNQRDALRCCKEIMPEIWRRFPDAELWIIGSNPPESIQALTINPRIKVTGYVKDVQELLAGMAAVICPWIGTYGFRSRLIEVMALGVPVVATPDAVYGMDLEHGRGLLLGESNEELIKHSLRLLSDAEFARQQSQRARQSVEQLYSIEKTYNKLMYELDNWLQRKARKIA